MRALRIKLVPPARLTETTDSAAWRTMYQWFLSLHPVLQALLAGLFTWSVTAVGAAAVLFTRHVNRKLLDSMLGFSGGVMLAASYWSLLAPAIEISEHGSTPA